jgi:hypothetical protein
MGVMVGAELRVAVGLRVPVVQAVAITTRVKNSKKVFLLFIFMVLFEIGVWVKMRMCLD